VLRPGGEFRFASDDAGYAEQALLLMRKSAAFEAPSGGAGGLRKRPPGWPETRYERKAMAEGRAPVYLSFRSAAKPA